MKTIKNVYKFQNNMLMVFDSRGDQMAEFQGECTPELMQKIWKHSDENTTFDGFGASGALNYREVMKGNVCQ